MAEQLAELNEKIENQFNIMTIVIEEIKKSHKNKQKGDDLSGLLAAF